MKDEKIIFTLPDSLAIEVDNIVQMENMNREDFAKEAFEFYISQKKKLSAEDSMMKGYMEMAQINLSLAELGMTNEVSCNDEEIVAQIEY